MRAALIAASLLALSTAAFAATPEQAFKASLADDNKDWATAPHAILKIQDAAYLSEGQSATLVGAKGKPASWHWVQGTQANGALIAHVANAHPVIVKDGKTYNDAEIAKGIAVDKDVDVVGAQTQVSAGVIGARFMVYNQQNADAKAFKGVDYFAYDPSYVVTGRFTPDPKREAHAFKTSRGTTKQFFHVGDASLIVNGKAVSLPFYADSNDPAKITSLAAFFTDGLTGKGAYGSGRYVDIDVKKFPPPTVTVDFNYAYNPNCSRSRFYTCPIATDNIDTEIKAGERDPHMAH
ncbi:MAG TPA: DUF1684 domain-containing protein [Rhizomicrobium sp.]|jgi:hypothetical protein|nr:DUF1684 domain-containing protein [Rhizomicrobium sp.]